MLNIMSHDNSSALGSYRHSNFFVQLFDILSYGFCRKLELRKFRSDPCLVSNAKNAIALALKASYTSCSLLYVDRCRTVSVTPKCNEGQINIVILFCQTVRCCYWRNLGKNKSLLPFGNTWDALPFLYMEDFGLPSATCIGTREHGSTGNCIDIS